MTACNQQIVSAFEDLGMTPEEIAADQDLELSAVKAILMQFSAAYRKYCKKDVEACFTDEEETMARQVIAEIARYNEDDRLRLRAAMYIRDDKKGRLDVMKSLVGLNFNALTFNDQMRKAIEAKNRSKSQVIDIPPEAKQLIEAHSK